MNDKTAKPETPESDSDDIESIVAAAEKAEAEALAEAEAAEAETDSGSEIERLESELDKAREDMMRALADAQNTRRRAEREVKETRDYAVSRFASDLLGVADNLARALDAVNRDEMGEAGKQLADGVELTQRALLTAFERHGVKRVDPAPGDAFDPNRHQATAQFPSEHAAGSIAVVMAPGYVIGERTLRAAMVAVSTGPAEAEGGRPDGKDGSVDVKA